jgi:ABC-2 type transport system ATP-binding protein
MIRVEHLVKSFGDLKAVDDVSFDVAAGEIFAFLGPNGAGKTTTIQMLTTLLRPTSGSMLLDGLDPAVRPHDVRRRFGIVFQDPSLDSELTAYENMELHGVLYHVPRRTRAGRIQQLLTLFELWDRRQSLVKQFSGGMKRRLEIARGLLHTPKILFLDEPTLGLDPQSRNQLWTHVKHLNATEQVTVFLTTHYMDGSGSRGAPHCHHRQRPHRRAGQRAGVEGPDRSRLAGARLPRAHGNHDSRRPRRRRGPDAPGREDVAAVTL